MGEVALLHLLLLPNRVANHVIRRQWRALQYLNVHAPRALRVKAPAITQPGFGRHPPSRKQVQVWPMPGRVPAGGELDEGHVLKGAEGSVDLGHKAGEGTAEALGEKLGGPLLLGSLVERRLAPKEQGLAEGECQEVTGGKAGLGVPGVDVTPLAGEEAGATGAGPALAWRFPVAAGRFLAEEAVGFTSHGADPLLGKAAPLDGARRAALCWPHRRGWLRGTARQEPVRRLGLVCRRPTPVKGVDARKSSGLHQETTGGTRAGCGLRTPCSGHSMGGRFVKGPIGS